MRIRLHYLRGARDAVLGRFPKTSMFLALSGLFDPHSLPNDESKLSSLTFGNHDLDVVLETWNRLVNPTLAKFQWASCPRQLYEYKVRLLTVR